MATRCAATLLIICCFAFAQTRCFSLSLQALPFSTVSLPFFSGRGAISVPRKALKLNLKAERGSSGYVALPDLIGKGKLQILLSQRGVLSKEIPCMQFQSTGRKNYVYHPHQLCVNLFSYTADPLQNCRPYYSPVMLDPQK